MLADLLRKKTKFSCAGRKVRLLWGYDRHAFRV